MQAMQLPEITLYHAAWQCRIDTLKQRIAAGDDVNQRGYHGWTPLLAIALVGAGTGERKAETATLLLDAGAEIDLTDEKGATALMYAAASPDVELVRLLIERGADVNRATAYGRVPLDFTDEHRAVPETKQILIDAGAKPPAPPDPLVLAVQAGDLATAKQLLAEGHAPNATDKHGKAALMHAAEKPDESLVRLLVQSGAAPNLTDAQGHSSLHAAARGGDAAVVRYLIEQGAEIEGTAPTTPLMSAAAAGQLESTRALIEAGANLKAKAPGNITVLSAARRSGRRKVVALVKNGPASNPRPRPDAVDAALFDAEAQRLGELFRKNGSAWKRRKGVVAFYPSSRRLLDLAEERFGPEPPPRDMHPDEHREQRLDRIVASLQDEVREKGFLLIEHDSTTKKPLLLFPTAEKYSVLAACGTNADNYGHDTDEVIDWLRDLEKTAPFLLTGCGHDFVAGRFHPPVEAMIDVAKRVAEFCPDLIDGDAVESPADLAAEMQKDQSLYLWWD